MTPEKIVAASILISVLILTSWLIIGCIAFHMGKNDERKQVIKNGMGYYTTDSLNKWLFIYNTHLIKVAKHE